MRAPITAVPVGGQVHLVVDTDTARDLADALELMYASGAADDGSRPEWMVDVARVKGAAAYADATTGRGPDPVVVPFMRKGGALC